MFVATHNENQSNQAKVPLLHRQDLYPGRYRIACQPNYIGQVRGYYAQIDP